MTNTTILDILLAASYSYYLTHTQTHYHIRQSLTINMPATPKAVMIMLIMGMDKSLW